MEITGRLTADAMANKTRNDNSVVNFSVAVNDRFKPKGSTEIKELTTYFDCSYWLNAKAANWLKKGTMVQLYGRAGINVYNNMDGKAVGRLTFHVNDIKPLVFPKSNGSSSNSPESSQANSTETDDLPF